MTAIYVILYYEVMLERITFPHSKFKWKNKKQLLYQIGKAIDVTYLSERGLSDNNW